MYDEGTYRNAMDYLDNKFDTTSNYPISQTPSRGATNMANGQRSARFLRQSRPSPSMERKYLVEERSTTRQGISNRSQEPHVRTQRIPIIVDDQHNGARLIPDSGPRVNGYSSPRGYESRSPRPNVQEQNQMKNGDFDDTGRFADPRRKGSSGYSSPHGYDPAGDRGPPRVQKSVYQEERRWVDDNQNGIGRFSDSRDHLPPPTYGQSSDARYQRPIYTEYDSPDQLSPPVQSYGERFVQAVYPESTRMADSRQNGRGTLADSNSRGNGYGLPQQRYESSRSYSERSNYPDEYPTRGPGNGSSFYPNTTSMPRDRQAYEDRRRTDYPRQDQTRRDQSRLTNLTIPQDIPRSSTNTPSPGRIVYDGHVEAKRRENLRSKAPADDREFMQKVQRELEDKKAELSVEMDRLSASTVLPTSLGDGLYNAERDSYVDTTSVRPIFKAFVDVREFPPSSVRVNVDAIGQKIVVEASIEPGPFSATGKTFTQKIPMPRFADESRLRARMNHEGILRVEVPLIFYFPDAEDRNDGRTKAFVYEVRSNPEDGSQVMEILVNCGGDVSARDLRIEIVEGNQLIIRTDPSSGLNSPTGSQGRIIKKYTLPKLANIDGITSRRTPDGRLAILIPIHKV